MFDVNEPLKRSGFITVREGAGNEYLCPMDALRDPKRASADKLKNCIETARVPEKFAGG
jgi:hypothetical protein